MNGYQPTITGGIFDRTPINPNPLPPLNPSAVDSVMLGFRGESRMDAGYFFVPHVPLTTTPTVIIGTDEFVPRQGIMTRYGERMLRDGAQYYANLSISNLSIRVVDETPHYRRLEAKGLINPTQLKYDPKMGF